MAPLERKKRRLVKLGEVAPTNEAPQAGETMGSSVSVEPLELAPLAIMPVGKLPQSTMLRALVQRQANHAGGASAATAEPKTEGKTGNT